MDENYTTRKKFQTIYR